MAASRQSQRHGWNRSQVRCFAKEVRASMGDAWRLFGPEVREAFAASRVFDVVSSQAHDISPDAARALLVDVEIALGLREG